MKRYYILIVLLLWHSFMGLARAEYLEPTIAVQRNEQTDLFEKSTGDWESAQREFNLGKDGAIERVKREQGIEFLAKDKDEVTGTAESLSAIRASELNSKGQEEVIKQDSINNLYLDYRKPLVKQHLKDAKKIAKGQDELMHRLLEKLQDIGVDCKTVKGPIQQEPTYYLQVEKEVQKDTVYNQTFCEELRNTYNCDDTVSLTCKRKGIGYGDWQAKTIKLNGNFLYGSAMNWGFAIKWKVGRWGWHITPYHPGGIKAAFGEVQVDSVWKNNPGAIIADARRLLAQVLKVRIDQIGENVRFPEGGRGTGNITELGGSQRWRAIWDEYEFGYDFREVFDTCEEWEEDWTERCRIK